MGVLPFPQEDDRDSWWPLLRSNEPRQARVFARLPFGDCGSIRGPEVEALAIGRVVPETIGVDRSLLVLEAVPELSRSTVRGMMTECGLEPRILHQRLAPSDPSSTLFLAELDGAVLPVRRPVRAGGGAAGRRPEACLVAGQLRGAAHRRRAGERRRIGEQDAQGPSRHHGHRALQGRRREAAGPDAGDAAGLERKPAGRQPARDRGLSRHRAGTPPLSRRRGGGSARRHRRGARPAEGAYRLRRRLRRADLPADPRLSPGRATRCSTASTPS